ncbi:hypothetical protein [Staphylococcus aureus]|nr:hypothetical protein [Staphylococcus aureus]
MMEFTIRRDYFINQLNDTLASTVYPHVYNFAISGFFRHIH